MFRNAWVQIHWFVGITAGVILAVVGLTGAVLSFEDEIQAALNRDTRTVPLRADAPLPPSALVTEYQRQFPDARVSSLQLSGEAGMSARVSVDRQNRYVDPYTGNALPGEGTRGRAFFQGTRSLHRWLVVGSFGNRDVGRHIVGVSTVLCTLLALSGLYLRWPKRASSWRAWLTFNPALKGRTFLWHLHSVLGTWVLVIFLMMSLTGPYWSWTWYRDGMYALAGAERPAPRGEGAQRERGAERERPAPPTANLDAAWNSFQQATASTGGFRTATLNLPQAPGGHIEIRYVDADPAHSRANNTLQVDATTGAVVRHERYDGKRLGEKLMSSVLALHAGSFFGLPGKTLFMIASLGMPLFTITGWIMYLQRRRSARAYAAAAQVSAQMRSRL